MFPIYIQTHQACTLLAMQLQHLLGQETSHLARGNECIMFPPLYPVTLQACTLLAMQLATGANLARGNTLSLECIMFPPLYPVTLGMHIASYVATTLTGARNQPFSQGGTHSYHQSVNTQLSLECIVFPPVTLGMHIASYCSYNTYWGKKPAIQLGGNTYHQSILCSPLYIQSHQACTLLAKCSYNTYWGKNQPFSQGETHTTRVYYVPPSISSHTRHAHCQLCSYNTYWGKKPAIQLAIARGTHITIECIMFPPLYPVTLGTHIASYVATTLTGAGNQPFSQLGGNTYHQSVLCSPLQLYPVTLGMHIASYHLRTGARNQPFSQGGTHITRVYYVPPSISSQADQPFIARGNTMNYVPHLVLSCKVGKLAMHIDMRPFSRENIITRVISVHPHKAKIATHRLQHLAICR